MRSRRFAIPTMYKGVRFRSRLEACYAAFFDEIHWPFQYEPFDLDGTIPDFVIYFERSPVIFEVKGPIEEVAAAKLKIEFSGWQHDAVIAAGNVTNSNLGLMLPRSEHVFAWEDAETFYCINCGQVSLLSGCGSWRCRRCGANEGHVGSFDPTAAWRVAMNRVQWRAAG